MIVNGYEIKPKANLRGVYLRGACLRGTSLRGADLSWANLRESDLRGSDLRGAYLHGVDFRGADLRRVDLSGAILPDFQIVPQEGAFVAFKKISSGVVKLEIPADARRTSSLVGRKCRAEFVKVLEGPDGFDRHSGKVNYKVGEIVYPDKYDDDIRVECTHGIHFFMTRKEAEDC